MRQQSMTTKETAEKTVRAWGQSAFGRALNEKGLRSERFGDYRYYEGVKLVNGPDLNTAFGAYKKG